MCAKFCENWKNCSKAQQWFERHPHRHDSLILTQPFGIYHFFRFSTWFLFYFDMSIKVLVLCALMLQLWRFMWVRTHIALSKRSQNSSPRLVVTSSSRLNNIFVIKIHLSFPDIQTIEKISGWSGGNAIKRQVCCCCCYKFSLKNFNSKNNRM